MIFNFSLDRLALIFCCLICLSQQAAANSEPMTDSLSNYPFLSLLQHSDRKTYSFSSTDPDCFDFGRNYGKSSFYIELLGGPDFVSRSLLVKTGLDNELLAQQHRLIRNSTESKKISWLAGVRISGVGQNNIAFRGGVFLNQIKEEFSAPGIQIVIDTIAGTMDTTNITITNSNKLKTIDFQFTVGYEMDFDKWTASINGGAMMNVVFSQTGQFINPGGDLASYSSDDPTAFPVFKNNAGFGLLSHVTVGYKISKNIHAVAEINFRYRLGALTRSDYLLDQSYTQIGVLGGLRYVIN